jgi:hypothetical protein
MFVFYTSSRALESILYSVYCIKAQGSRLKAQGSRLKVFGVVGLFDIIKKRNN